MKRLSTVLFLSLFAICLQAQCLVNFVPASSGDSLVINGQGVDTTIYGSALLGFNGQGSITFEYGGSDGSAFSYDCGSIFYSSGSVNDGFTHFEASPLPVELSYLKFVTKDDIQYLEWQTASEENNLGFEVQSSTDGVDFKVIGFVDGNGTTLEVNTYQYEIEITELTYLRLKQIDFDGQFEYSDMIVVNGKGVPVDLEIQYSNIVQNELSVTGDGFARITNQFGQVLKEIELTESGLITIDVSDFSSGMYNITLVNIDSGGMKTLRFLKQ